MNTILSGILLGFRWWWLNVRHVLLCARISLISMVLGGCAHPVPAATRDPSLIHAAAISDAIDAKTVIVQQWLRSH